MLLNEWFHEIITNVKVITCNAITQIIFLSVFIINMFDTMGKGVQFINK